MTVDREEEVSDDDDDNVTHNGDTDNHRDKNWGPDTDNFSLLTCLVEQSWPAAAVWRLVNAKQLSVVWVFT